MKVRNLLLTAILGVAAGAAQSQGPPDFVWTFGGLTGSQPTSVATSTDGRIIVGLDLGEVVIWDEATQQVHRTLGGQWTNTVSLDPSADGTFILRVSGFGAIATRLSDAADIMTIGFSGYPEAVTAGALSPDDSVTVLGTSDGNVRAFAVPSGTELWCGNVGEAVTSVAYSPSGETIAVATTTGGVHFFSAGGSPGKTLPLGISNFRLMKYSADGQHLILAGPDSFTRVYSAATGALVRTLAGHTGAVKSLDISPDGQRIVTGSADRTARVWQSATGQLLTTITGHTASVGAVGFTADGNRVVTASFDKSVRVWTSTGGFLATLTKQLGSTDTVVFSPDGKMLASGSYPAVTLRKRDGEFIGTLAHPREVLSAAFSPDGSLLATGSADLLVRVWNVQTRTMIRILDGGHGQWGYIRSVRFSPDGTRLAAGGTDGKLNVWRTSDWTLAWTANHGQDGMRSLDYSPQGTLIATGNVHGLAKLWDAADGTLVRAWQPSQLYMFDMKFSPDGLRIAVSSSENSIKLYDVAGGAQVGTIPAQSVQAFNFSPEGDMILAGHYSAMRMYKVSDGTLWRTFDQETSHIVKSVAYSPDSRFMAYGRYNPMTSLVRNPLASSPESFTINRGIHMSGGLDQLIEQDGEYLVVRPGLVLSSGEPPVRIVVQGTANLQNPSLLRLRIEAAASVHNISQTTELYDFAAAEWVFVETRLATTTPSVTDVFGWHNPGRFVEPGTMAVRARVSWRATGPVLTHPWTIRLGQTYWLFTP